MECDVIHVKRRTCCPGFSCSCCAQNDGMGVTPATRIQICGPYHGSDSPPETTHTRHHRSNTRQTDTLSATQDLLGHANRVQPYPQTATGSLESQESILPASPLPSVRRGGPSSPRASVIDGRDLATVTTTACGRSSLFSANIVSWAPCNHICFLACQPVSLLEDNTPHCLM